MKEKTELEPTWGRGAEMSGRIDPEKIGTKEAYLLYLRHLFAYEFAAKTLSGNSIVLEVGSGEGYGSSLLSKYVKVIALDVVEEVVQAAQGKYGSTSCSFQLYDGKRIPLKDNSFDACVSFQVIEHIEDDMNFVLDVRRVLREEGIFILTTPNRAYRLAAGQKPFNPCHVREYHHWELGNLLKRFFGEVKVLGISATEEVREIQMKRVRPSVVTSLDMLNLRRFLPAETRKELAAILDKMRGLRAPIEAKDQAKYTTKDFHIVDDAGRGLDILEIAESDMTYVDCTVSGCSRSHGKASWSAGTASPS